MKIVAIVTLLKKEMDLSQEMWRKKQVQTDGSVIVDVRTLNEYKMGHIENSQLLDIQEPLSFINQLKIFKIGMSWGGVNSLAVVYPDLQRPNQDFGGRIVRLNIGLEGVEDLIGDLSQAMAKAS